MADKNTIKNKIISKATAWALNHLDLIFSILRWVKPDVVVKGNAVITRFEDVTEVLDRHWVFQVPYAEKMGKVTSGHNFFLGMQDTEQYTRDVSNMRLAARREGISEIVTPFVTNTCTDILAASSGKMDVIQKLTRVVPTRLLGRHFGTPGWNESEFTDAATNMFQYLFYPDDPEVEKKALDAAEKTRNYLDQTITARKSYRGQHDDVIERCLKLQDAGNKLIPEAYANDIEAKWKDFHGRLGGEVVTWAYSNLLPHKEIMIRPLSWGSPWFERVFTKYFYGLSRDLICKTRKLNKAAADRALINIKKWFEKVDGMLADGRKYLFGDRMTLADLAFAVSGAPVVLPNNYGGYQDEQGPISTFEQFPKELQETITEMRVTPAGKFILRLYAEERFYK